MIATALMESSQKMRTAQDQLVKSQEHLNNIQLKLEELRIRMTGLEELDRALPQLKKKTTVLHGQATTLMEKFTEIKDKSSQLLLLIRQMQNDATTYTKNSFAEGILRLCKASVIDLQVCDEVDMIGSEIMSGFTSFLPPLGVTSLLTEGRRSIERNGLSNASEVTFFWLFLSIAGRFGFFKINTTYYIIAFGSSDVFT